MSHAQRNAQHVNEFGELSRNEFIPLSAYGGGGDRPAGSELPSAYTSEIRRIESHISANATWAADMTKYVKEEKKIRTEEVALLRGRLERDEKANAERIDKEKRLREEQTDRAVFMLANRIEESRKNTVSRFASIEKEFRDSGKLLDLVKKREEVDRDNIHRLMDRTTALEKLEVEKLIGKRLKTAKSEMAASHAQVEQKLMQKIADLDAQLRAEQDRRAQQEATANKTDVQSELQTFVSQYEKVSQITFETWRADMMRDFKALLDVSLNDIQRDFCALLETREAGMRRDCDAALAEAKRLASMAETSASTASAASTAATKTQPQTPPDPKEQGHTTPPDSVAGGRKRRATAAGGMRKKSKY